jgi:DNA-binding response OmpR family regulator
LEIVNRKRVFLLEDEMMLALLLQAMLQTLEYEAVGPPANIIDGLRLAREEPLDLAVLDVGLADTYTYMIADALRERQIPVLFLSDSGTQTPPGDFGASARLDKPFEIHDLETALYSLQWKGLSAPLNLTPPNA